MASNGSTISDEDGDFDDWIELFNNSDDSIVLSGLFLTDNAANPTKWKFPKSHSNILFFDKYRYIL